MVYINLSKVQFKNIYMQITKFVYVTWVQQIYIGIGLNKKLVAIYTIMMAAWDYFSFK